VRIAQITSVYISVPPKTHGGTERVVASLVNGLVRRGHRVSLFASGDSRTEGELQAVAPEATLTAPGMTVYLDKEYETRNTFNLYRQADRFDVIHAHWPTLAPYFSSFTQTPTVLTYAYIEERLHQYYKQHFPNMRPVCISKQQAKWLKLDAPVIYNGIEMADMPFSERAGDYLVLVARIIPTKGIAEAIRIAKAVRERLVIVGYVSPYIPWTRAYYEEQVKPHVDGDRVRHYHELSGAETLSLVSKAKGFLFPLQWDEPFGMAVVEAMACGTPVVAYPRGAMPELVKDGETGFLPRDERGMLDAIKRLGDIDRKACRALAKKRFSAERMVREYEAFYRQVAKA